MSNTSKIELSIPELSKLNELMEQLISKLESPATSRQAAQQAVSAAAQMQADPPTAPAAAPATPTTATPATASPAAFNPALAFPFTAPAQAANAPHPPAAVLNAYGSTPAQAYPSNPAAAAQPTYPPQIQQPAPAPQQPPVTTGITYTVEQIANAAAPIMQRGDGQKLVELLAKYKVQALTQLDARYLPSFAADIRALGAQI